MLKTNFQIFIYTFSFNELISNPFRNAHAGSLLGITTIDLFGDYFNRYWDHDRSLFFSNRDKVITSLEYPRRNLSVFFSLIFFVLLTVMTVTWKSLCTRTRKCTGPTNVASTPCTERGDARRFSVVFHRHLSHLAAWRVVPQETHFDFFQHFCKRKHRSPGDWWRN